MIDEPAEYEASSLRGKELQSEECIFGETYLGEEETVEKCFVE